MSVNTSRFSLRGAKHHETSATDRTPAHSLLCVSSNVPPPTEVSSTNKLKFDFTSLQQQPAPRSSEHDRRQIPLSFANEIPAVATQQLRNPFEAKNTNKADVASLAATIDDLNARVKDAIERNTATEQQLQRVSQALVTERHNASQRIRVVKEELTISHASEDTLRGEVERLQKVAIPIESQEEYQNALASATQACKQSELDKSELHRVQALYTQSEHQTKSIAEELALSRANEDTLRGEVERLQKVAIPIESQEEYQNALASATQGYIQQSELDKSELHRVQALYTQSEHQTKSIAEELALSRANEDTLRGEVERLQKVAIPIESQEEYQSALASATQACKQSELDKSELHRVQALYTESEHQTKSIAEELALSRANEDTLRGEVERLQKVAIPIESQEEYQSALASATQACKQSELDKSELHRVQALYTESEHQTKSIAEELALSRANEDTLRGEVERLQKVAIPIESQEEYQNALASATQACKQSELDKSELHRVQALYTQSEHQTKSIAEELALSRANEDTLRGEVERLQKVAIPIESQEEYQSALASATQACKQSELDKSELHRVQALYTQSEHQAKSIAEELALSRANEDTLRGEVERLQKVAIPIESQEEYQNTLASATQGYIQQSELDKSELHRVQALYTQSEHQAKSIAEELALSRANEDTLRDDVDHLRKQCDELLLLNTKLTQQHDDTLVSLNVALGFVKAGEEDVSTHLPSAPMPIDPVDMHTEYHEIRTRLLKTTAILSCMQNNPGDYVTQISKLEASRDRLRTRAHAIKERYDILFETEHEADDKVEHVLHAIFGTCPTVGNEEAEEKDVTLPAVSSKVSTSSSPTTDTTFMPLGNKPKSQYVSGYNEAHVEAKKCILGNALNPCKQGCNFDVGATEVMPLASQFVFSDNLGDNGGMSPLVSAVVADLTNFFQSQLPP